MSQLSLYLDDSTISTLSAGAKEKGCSLSRYVAFVIDDYFADKARRNEETRRIIRELYDTAVPEYAFDEPPDVPYTEVRPVEGFE